MPEEIASRYKNSVNFPDIEATFGYLAGQLDNRVHPNLHTPNLNLQAFADISGLDKALKDKNPAEKKFNNNFMAGLSFMGIQIID